MLCFLEHLLIVVLGVSVILGPPLISSDFFVNYIKHGDVDAVTSATAILDQPSGNYVILINPACRTDSEKMKEWAAFFDGGEISYIFEDISCSVANGDSGALDMARSFQSRLPENQMRIQTEDQALMLSRADYGRFDIIIMSVEFAEAKRAYTAYRDGVEVINVQGEQE